MEIKNERERKIVDTALHLMEADHSFCINGRKSVGADDHYETPVEKLEEDVRIIKELRKRLASGHAGPA